VQDALFNLQAWFKHDPSKTDHKKMWMEFVDLLANKASSGEPLHVLVTPYDIDNSIPSDKEIGKSVGRLHIECSPGPTVMRAEE
jgi:hypothetical protein